MNETDVQKILFEHFATLNESSGIEFLTADNVCYNNNKKFTPPSDKRFFKVSFLSDKPSIGGIFEDAPNNYAGILQIDICVPLDKGESEAETKYNALSKLFKRGLSLGDVEIGLYYIADKSAESDYYKLVTRVEWSATLY